MNGNSSADAESPIQQGAGSKYVQRRRNSESQMCFRKTEEWVKNAVTVNRQDCPVVIRLLAFFAIALTVGIFPNRQAFSYVPNGAAGREMASGSLVLVGKRFDTGEHYSDCWNIVDLLVDVPSAFAGLEESPLGESNLFSTAVRHAGGTENYRRLLLMHEVKALANLKGVKSIIPLGLIDRFFPIYVSADKSVNECRAGGCSVTLWLRDYQTSSAIDYELVKGGVTIGASSTVRFSTHFIEDDLTPAGSTFYSPPSQTYHLVEVFGMETRVLVGVSPAQLYCTGFGSSSELCREQRKSLPEYDAEVLSDRNRFLHYSIQVDDLEPEWANKKCP
jgi:hypothetical protein